MKYLGIDYGTKRVGLATSDENGKLAFPYGIIPAGSDLLEKIAEICEKEKIAEIVIGLSVDREGKENPLMEKINTFIAQFSFLNPIPIHLQQEAFTSVHIRQQDNFMSVAKNRQARKIKKTSPKRVDDAAATLILQRYLDKQNNG